MCACDCACGCGCVVVCGCVCVCGCIIQTTPLVRVAVEPKHQGDMAALKMGLRLLNQADPCVEVVVAESGELHLVALGELHLERCLDDLRTRFARVDVQVRGCVCAAVCACVCHALTLYAGLTTHRQLPRNDREQRRSSTRCTGCREGKDRGGNRRICSRGLCAAFGWC